MQEKNVLNDFKSRLFSIKKLDKLLTPRPTFESAFQLGFEPTPETIKATIAKTKRKISSLKLREKF